jgi:hypothetical protein
VNCILQGEWYNSVSIFERRTLKMKKLLSLVLVLTMILALGAFGPTASADESYTVGIC